MTGQDFEEDYRVMSPDGAPRVVNSRGRMLKDASGKVTSFLGMLMDVTRRNQAEQEREVIALRLRKLTAIHETVLSATNSFAYVFDVEGRFLYANRPLCALYGRPLEEVGRTFIELGYPAWHAEMHLQWNGPSHFNPPADPGQKSLPRRRRHFGHLRLHLHPGVSDPMAARRGRGRHDA